jgi:hypothetical protein
LRIYMYQIHLSTKYNTEGVGTSCVPGTSHPFLLYSNQTLLAS